MKLTYSKSQYDVPEGQYTAKFTGLELLEPKPGEGPRMGRDGKPMAPGMAWRFEIAEGPEAGKRPDRVTSRLPTPKNICGRFLVAVTGQILKDGMEVDTDRYIGKFYRINVIEKDQSDGTCVSDQGLVPVPAPNAFTQAAAANGNGSAAPPPRKSGPPAASAQKYWVEIEGADPLQLTEPEVRNWFNQDAKRDPGKINVCKVGDQEWKAASDLFNDLIPF
jgi:hypothetical protein